MPKHCPTLRDNFENFVHFGPFSFDIVIPRIQAFQDDLGMPVVPETLWIFLAHSLCGIQPLFHAAQQKLEAVHFCPDWLDAIPVVHLTCRAFHWLSPMAAKCFYAAQSLKNAWSWQSHLRCGGNRVAILWWVQAFARPFSWTGLQGLKSVRTFCTLNFSSQAQRFVRDVTWEIHGDPVERWCLNPFESVWPVDLLCIAPISQVDFEARQRAELIPTIPQAEAKCGSVHLFARCDFTFGLCESNQKCGWLMLIVVVRRLLASLWLPVSRSKESRWVKCQTCFDAISRASKEEGDSCSCPNLKTRCLLWQSKDSCFELFSPAVCTVSCSFLLLRSSRSESQAREPACRGWWFEDGCESR